MAKEGEVGKGSIVIYQGKGGVAKLEVRLEKETVWLSQLQMARLFGKTVPTINEHIKNMFKEKELEERSTIRKFRIVQNESGRSVERDIDFYNLDVIISVGYRVKSKEGTQFRIWATRVLKSYLIKGYALNEKRLLEQGIKLKELQTAISFINSKSSHPELTGRERLLLDLVNEYSNSLTLLHQFDDKVLELYGRKRPSYVLTYDESKGFIEEVRGKLQQKGEASGLFGQEISHKFDGIIGALYQTFDKKELYPSVEEKAAHLLYLVIKDHPFGNGNKRIGSLLFISYLDRNDYLRRESGEKKIADTTIVALALLVATSHPSEKDVMIKIITNLLK